MSNANDKMDVLFGKVYLPTFMQKLAARNVPVQSEGDLQEALKIAAMTRMHQDSAPVQEKPSLLKEASAKLEAMTFGQPDATAQYMQDPEIIAALQ